MKVKKTLSLLNTGTSLNTVIMNILVQLSPLNQAVAVILFIVSLLILLFSKKSVQFLCNRKVTLYYEVG
jgi:hypothetical protein